MRFLRHFNHCTHTTTIGGVPTSRAIKRFATAFLLWKPASPPMKRRSPQQQQQQQLSGSGSCSTRTAKTTITCDSVTISLEGEGGSSLTLLQRKQQQQQTTRRERETRTQEISGPVCTWRETPSSTLWWAGVRLMRRKRLAVSNWCFGPHPTTSTTAKKHHCDWHVCGRPGIPDAENRLLRQSASQSIRLGLVGGGRNFHPAARGVVAVPI